VETNEPEESTNEEIEEETNGEGEEQVDGSEGQADGEGEQSGGEEEAVVREGAWTLYRGKDLARRGDVESVRDWVSTFNDLDGLKTYVV